MRSSRLKAVTALAVVLMICGFVEALGRDRVASGAAFMIVGSIVLAAVILRSANAGGKP